MKKYFPKTFAPQSIVKRKLLDGRYSFLIQHHTPDLGSYTFT